MAVGLRFWFRDRRKDRPLMGLPPDFLSTSLASRNFMRLSLMKAAHVAFAGASSRKFGSPQLS
jgi:hypothetical protein